MKELTDYMNLQDFVFMMTEKCNSNCVMCPMSEDARRRGRTFSNPEIDEMLQKITDETEHIDITGGEPFLKHEQLFHIMRDLNEKHPYIPVQILTNGRALCLPSIQAQIKPLLRERYLFAIPVHGPDAVSHDAISETYGSFAETMEGLRFLSHEHARIEVRIVGSKLNAHQIQNTCAMLAASGLHIHVVNIIAMEMTGSAARNRSQLWIDYRQLYRHAEQGILQLIRHGIDVRLYNFPLCALPRSAWPLAKSSISPWKIRYPAACDCCAARDACGGLFYSTQLLRLFPVRPFSKEEC